MGTFRFVASIVGFALVLLVPLLAFAYVVMGGPGVPVWTMLVPALLFGLTVTAALDKPLGD